MKLFRLDSSVRTTGSVSRALADSAEAVWRQEHEGGVVVRRDLASTPVPADAFGHAAAAAWLPAEERTPEQSAALALGAELGDELIAADAYLFAVPLYNFGVSQHVKAWVDLLTLDPRFAPGSMPLAGRPALLVIARGGGYGEGTPRAGWDHATPWLRRIFTDVWGLSLEIAAAELTLAGSNPAMAHLVDAAAASLDAAHAAARSHALTLRAATGERAAA